MSKEEILLVKKAVDGDVVAFETLIKSHEKRIYNICLRTMGNTEDAFDASQEALIKVWRNLKGFKGNSAFSTWVYRISVNTCLDILRKKRIKTQSADRLHEKGWDIADDKTPFDERVVGGDSIKHALGMISDEHKIMLELRDIQGFSYEDISGILGCPLGTVRSRIYRARNALKNSLIKYDEGITV